MVQVSSLSQPIVKNIASSLVGNGLIISSPLQLSPDIWYDPSDETSVIRDMSDKVSQVTDLSGNARHATQTNAARQPTFVASGINGLGSIDFDGTTSNLRYDESFLDGSSFDIFIVAKNNLSAPNSSTTLISGQDTVNILIMRAEGARAEGGWVANAPFGNKVVTNGATASVDTQHLYNCSNNESALTLSIFHDGVFGGSIATTGAPTNYSPGRIGSRIETEVTKYDGLMSEMTFFARVLSERTALNNYLLPRWGV